MSRIFVSYRREDAKDVAGRLYDRLKAQFGESEVFLDVEASHGGKFLDRIKQEADSCEVMVVLIGQSWLTIQDKAGRPRLFNNHDFVRIECRMGLKKALMIPTTVEDARLPTREELPADIADMVGYDAAEIRYTRFDDDVKRLIGIIEKKVPAKAPAAVSERKTSPGWAAVLGQVLSAFVEGNRQPAAAPASLASPEPSPAGGPVASSLARVIPGLWQLQIMYPNGMTGQATALFESRGNFRAEGRSRAAMFTINGTWHVDTSDQVSLRGQQFDGVQTLPYHAVVGFSEVSADTMVSALNTGERAVWQRMQ